MSKPLRFYYDLMSQPARGLYMFLKLNQIPYEGVRIDIAKGQHLTEDYQNINRFKKIPCIVDGDFKLAESVAIYRYLASEYKVNDHWYPKDAKKRARVDEYLEWQHLNMRLSLTKYVWSAWLLRSMTGKTVTEAKLNASKKEMEAMLDLFTKLWLKDSQFIAGDEITLADLVAATEVEQLGPTNYNAFEGRPQLKKWIELVKSRTNPHYEDAHKMIYKVAALNKAKL